MLEPARQDDRVAFINIDAEGHEFAVLRGGEGLIASHRPVLLVEIEYRHGSEVLELFGWLQARRYVPQALVDGAALSAVDPIKLYELQGKERLARRLAGNRHSGYINNVFFLPEA
jgi:hypothetical protein